MKRKHLFIFSVVIIILALTVFVQGRFAVFFKTLVLGELNKLIYTKADIGAVKVSLPEGVIYFSNLRVGNPPDFNERYFLEIEKGYVDIGLRALLFKRIDIERIFVNSPHLNIEINRDGVSNTSLIFKKMRANKNRQSLENPAKEDKTRFRIKKVNIKDGNFRLINYRANLKGAELLFDEIDILVENLTRVNASEGLPTFVEASLRLPAADSIGYVELKGRGSFLKEYIDFDLTLDAGQVSIAYFMPFYINSAPILATQGRFDLGSQARCRKSELYAMQKVNVRDLAVVLNPSGISDNLIFGLPVNTVVEFFINSRGDMDFDFEVTGAISDPKFHLTEAFKKVLAESIGKAILNRVSKLSEMLLKKVKKTDDIKEAGKEVLKDVFQKILGPKE